MKRFTHTMLCCLLFCLNAIGQTNITDIEYFFDSDTGIGNATNLEVTNVASLDENVNIPISNLNTGIHILHMRCKNEANQWSLYSRQPFYISNFSSVLNNTITEAEYFIDTDPGAGNASALSIETNSNLDTSFAIPLNSVPVGLHILHIRVKNNLNQWGLYARQVFYKSPQILGNTIVEAEYFIDADPGVGNAESLAISQGESVNEFISIPLNSVTEGVHVLHIRAKNDLNQWSLYARQVFYKSPQILGNDIVAAEYFIDEDPGIGNAETVSIMQGASVDEILNIVIPEDLAEGEHVLHIRVQRSDGSWSLYGRPEFTTLSTNETVFDSFKMYPNPVNDILNISIQNGQIEKVVIIDINGKKVKEQTSQLEQLNLESLASGTYIIQITTSLGSVSKKLIKK